MRSGAVGAARLVCRGTEAARTSNQRAAEARAPLAGRPSKRAASLVTGVESACLPERSRPGRAPGRGPAMSAAGAPSGGGGGAGGEALGVPAYSFADIEGIVLHEDAANLARRRVDAKRPGSLHARAGVRGRACVAPVEAGTMRDARSVQPTTHAPPPRAWSPARQSSALDIALAQLFGLAHDIYALVGALRSRCPARTAGGVGSSGRARAAGAHNSGARKVGRARARARPAAQMT